MNEYYKWVISQENIRKVCMEVPMIDAVKVVASLMEEG